MTKNKVWALSTTPARKSPRFCGLAVFGIAFVLTAAVLVTACGGGGKSLAKEAYELTQQTLAAGMDTNKLSQIGLKAASVQDKVNKLSDKEKAIYTASLADLMAGGTGDVSVSDVPGASAGNAPAPAKGGATASKDSDFKYDLTADGKGVVIKGLQGDFAVVKIPAKIEGYPVVEVAHLGPELLSFDDSTNAITSVTIPDSVTVLGKDLFWRTSITKISLPKGITVLPTNLFHGCKFLTSVTIPNGVKEIGYGAFGFCKALKEITIPDSVTKIGKDAFENCSELTTVKLPSHPIEYLKVDDQGLEFNGNWAFSGCSKLSLAVRKAITDSGYKDNF